MASGDMTQFDTSGDAFFTGEEMIAMMVLDPKFKTDAAKRLARQQGIGDKDYVARAKRGDFVDAPNIEHKTKGNVPLVNGDIASRSGRGAFPHGSGVSGGVAFATLVPLIAPAVGPLVKLAISGIGKLFGWLRKKKGRGAFPHGVRGRGDIDDQKVALQEAVEEEKPEIEQSEQRIAPLRGNQFWRELMRSVKDHVQQIVLNARLASSQSNAASIAEAAINKSIPTSYKEQVLAKKEKEVQGSGNNKPESSRIRSLVRPVAVWAIMKIVKGQSPDKVRDLVNKVASKLDIKYPSGTAENLMKTVLDEARKVAIRTITRHFNTGTDEDQIRRAVSSVVMKFAVDKGPFKERIKSLINTSGDGVFNMTPFNSITRSVIARRPTTKPVQPIITPRGSGRIKKKGIKSIGGFVVKQI